MTCWQSLFETVGISRHLREVPSGNSSSHRDLLPAFDPRFKSKHIKTTIIQVYAPTNDADTNEKDGFFELLQQVYDRTPRHDIIITMGNWNAKLGHQMEGENGVVGRHGLGSDRSDNGERFIEFCAANNMAIITTMFPHKDIHKYTGPLQMEEQGIKSTT